MALSLLAVGLAARVAAQGMALPGKLDVTPTGAASYTVPIAVPPGTAGMVPSLSIAYNSQARNGLLGVGWHLEGLPSVGRCPRTIAQDGVRGSVNYDADDRFCLDGQRLVAISGTYGADGTEYRTEIESFSKVISHGTAGTGPAWFEVWTKSGQRMEFGNTTDSRVLAQGKTVARDWVVNKVSDTKGNYFTITYVNDTTNGQVYPSRIDYTGNAGAGLAPYNSVRFAYNTARPDVVPVYHLGSLQKTTALLTNVQTFSGSTLVADYKLAYEQSSITGRSRLTSVTLCHGGGACLPATTFAWQNGTLTATVVTNVAGQDGQLSGYRPYLADFNGDGLVDIMWDQGGSSSSPSSTGTRVLWTGTGGSNFTVTSNFAGQNGTLSGHTPEIADFNRDNRSDVLWHAINSSGATVGPTTNWLSTNAGTPAVISPGPTFPEGNVFLRVRGLMDTRLTGFADFNGDARTDMLLSPPGGRFGEGIAATIYVISADGTFSSTSAIDACTTVTIPIKGLCELSGVPADINGDGLTDLVWITNASMSGKQVGLMQRKGDGTFIGLPGTGDSGLHDFTPYFIDANGDGNVDIVWDRIDGDGRSAGVRRLWLGKGDGTFISQSNLAGRDGTLVGYIRNIGDFNGDGFPDILWVQADTNGLSTGTRELWLGKGDGTFSVAAGPDNPPVGYAPFVADFNGDGKADILWDKRSGSDTRSQGQRVLWLSDGVAPDLMTSVTTGVGANATITYKSLTDSSVYTKDSAAADPVIDLQGAMFAVSQVKASNGVGGTISTGYAYVGAKVHLDGRGFLGFRQMKVTDLQTNILQTTSYNQTFPLLGLVASETKKLDAVTLNQTTHTYQFLNAGGGTIVGQTGAPYRVSLIQSVAGSSDLDGSSLPSVTSTYQHDTYGNPTRIAMTASDGHGKTTINTYTNDSAKWLLGRLTRASVKSCPPGGSCASCSLPWGGQLTSGGTITSYKEAKATFIGCVSETRSCIDGSLSGSYQFATCTPYAPASMVFNGTNQALVRTLSTTSPSSTKFTYSMWVKPAGYDSKTNVTLFQVINAPSNSQWTVTGILASGARVGIDQNLPSPAWGEHNNASPGFGTGTWHHIVFRYDSSLGTSDRIRIYQNGVLRGLFSATNPGQNATHQTFANGRQHQVGGWLDVSRFLKGKLAFIDVLQDISVGPEAFASSKNGKWTRRPYTGSFGTYGFSLDGSTGVLGQDVGPNAQHFTGLNMTAANLDPADLPPHDLEGGGAGFASALEGAPAPTVMPASSEVQQGVVSSSHAPMK